MIETILLALAVFHGTLLIVITVLATADRPLRTRMFARFGSRAERFLTASCCAHLPRTTYDEELIDLTRWIGGCP
jgi:hypothetical protein